MGAVTDREPPVPARADPAADPAPAPAPLHPSTLAVTAGRPARERRAAEHPDHPGLDLRGRRHREYGRYGNPTWAAFEDALGALEGGRALSFSSGLAAVSVVLDLVGQGATVVAPRHSYSGTLLQLADLESRGRVHTELVDVTDTEATVKACADAALVWLESPTNPALEIADIETIAAAAHEAGAYVVVDNTFATPLLQRPLSLGADLVVHSATKYLGGHSDLLMGAVVTCRRRAVLGAQGPPRPAGGRARHLEACLALRGMRTLHLRVERAQANATELVRRLRDHPALCEVRYPGFGGIVSIVLAGGELAADLLTHKTSLWVHTTSLGGVESTFERRRRWKAEPASIPDALVRLSVGIEDVEDLWADLVTALDTLTT